MFLELALVYPLRYFDVYVIYHDEVAVVVCCRNCSGDNLIGAEYLLMFEVNIAACSAVHHYFMLNCIQLPSLQRLFFKLHSKFKKEKSEIHLSSLKCT